MSARLPVENIPPRPPGVPSGEALDALLADPAFMQRYNHRDSGIREAARAAVARLSIHELAELATRPAPAPPPARDAAAILSKLAREYDR
ncbi:MAG: hypothetical protein IOC54_16810 [Methylobacterium sp.]|nr:hypothetical protein [Methylobacterium sp.]MCA3653472.1 hypothetical protein [Methylobacterium sp.]MCA4923325.1 hypothetical protein [Methylobacterium sp.]